MSGSIRPEQRAFDEALESELSRSFKTDNVFTVLALDIDHFKVVNDTYGHLAGDRVIREVADMCREVFDNIGQSARTGGEEFTILIPDMNAQEAKPLAEALRQRVEDLVVKTDTSDIKFTTSIGVSEVSFGDKIASQVLSRADEALYDAKHSGRNRVCMDKIALSDTV